MAASQLSAYVSAYLFKVPSAPATTSKLDSINNNLSDDMKLLDFDKLIGKENKDER